MKTIRLVSSESYPEQGYVIYDDEFIRDSLNCYVIEDGYFVMSTDVPKFDPRNGLPLTYLEKNNDCQK